MEKHFSNQGEEIMGDFEEDAKKKKDLRIKKPYMRLGLRSDLILESEISSESFDVTSKSLDELKQLKYSIVSPKYFKTEVASPSQEKVLDEGEDSIPLQNSFLPLLLAYNKNFSNIIELNESVDSSQELIPNPCIEIKTSFDKDLSKYFQEIGHLNYASTLEDLENSNKALQEENALMSLKIEQTYKESRLAIDNIEDSVIQMLKHNLKNSQESILISQEKLKNYQDKFFFQILKFTESLNYKLAKNDGKMQNLENLYQKLKQNLIISHTNYTNLQRKYAEILHERIVLQERSENKTAMILNMRMAIESMNFARDQVSKLPNFESKKILQVFLDKIQAFQEAIEVFAKICDQNENISEVYIALNKENKILKKKLSFECKNAENFRARFEEFDKFICSAAFEIEDLVNKKLEDFDEKIKYLKVYVWRVIEEKCNQRNKELISLVEELNSKIIEKDEENAKLMRKNEEIFENYEYSLKFVSEFNMIRNENAILVKKIEEMEGYEYKLSMITNENADLLARLKEMKEHKYKISMVTKENMNLVSKLEELEKYKNEISILTDENADLIAKLKDFNNIQQELSSLFNENASLISKLEELEKTQSQLSVLANENSNLISEIQQHERTQYENAKAMHDLNTKNAKLASDLEFLTLEKAEITILVADKHKKLQQAESKIKELDEKCNKLEKHKEELERIIEIMAKTHREEQLVYKSQSQSSFEESVTMSKTTPKMPVSDEKLSEITEKLNEKSKEIKFLRQSQDILQNTNEDLVKKCENLKKKIEELEDLEENLKFIKEENSSLAEKLQGKNQEIESLHQTIESVSESNSKLMKKIKRMTRKVTSLKETNKFLVEYDKKCEMISPKSFIDKEDSSKFVFGEGDSLHSNYEQQSKERQTEISQVITISITPTHFHKRRKSLIDVESLFLSKIYIEKIRSILYQDETLDEKPELNAKNMTVIEAFEVLELNYIRLKDRIQSQDKEEKDIEKFELSKKCANLENTLKTNHEELLQLKDSIIAHSKSFNGSLQKISELDQELENSEAKILLLQKQTEDQSSLIIKLTESLEQSSKPSKELLKSVKHLKSKQKSITKSWSITKQAQDLIGSYTQSYISQVETLIEKLKSQEEVIGLLEEKLRHIGMMYENEDNKMKKYKKKYKILSDKFNELTSDYEVVYREYTYVSEQLQSQKSLNNERMAGTISLYEGKIKVLVDELNASKA